MSETNTATSQALTSPESTPEAHEPVEGGAPPESTTAPHNDQDNTQRFTHGERHGQQAKQIDKPRRAVASDSNARKSDKLHKRQETTKAHAELTKSVKLFIEERVTQVEAIAELHNTTPAYINRMVNEASVFKPTRAPNLYNALLHKKGVELNAGTHSLRLTTSYPCS